MFVSIHVLFFFIFLFVLVQDHLYLMKATTPRFFSNTTARYPINFCIDSISIYLFPPLHSKTYTSPRLRSPSLPMALMGVVEAAATTMAGADRQTQHPTISTSHRVSLTSRQVAFPLLQSIFKSLLNFIGKFCVLPIFKKIYQVRKEFTSNSLV